MEVLQQWDTNKDTVWRMMTVTFLDQMFLASNNMIVELKEFPLVGQILTETLWIANGLISLVSHQDNTFFK
jgi:hypothetical protein